jgi:signal transduction histidine kinase/DNA-binding response OmpR family regulator
MNLPFKLNTKIVVLLGFIFVLVVTIYQGYIASGYINDLSENNLKLQKYYMLSQKISGINKNLSLLESTSRGYVISNDKTFLNDFEEIESELIIQTEELKNYYTVEFNEAQYLKLKQLIESKMEFINLIILINNEKGSKTAMNLIKEGKGKRIMDKILSYSESLYEKTEMNQLIFESSGKLFVEKINKYRILAIITELFIILVATVVLFREINNRNRLEKILKKEKKKAEESSVIKEHFMANMSHEIRTPMNAIIGYTNLLNKTTLNEKQTEYLHSIKTSGEGLLNIINDILDFSKIEAGMFHIDKVDFSIAHTLNAIQSIFKEKENDKNLSFQIYMDEKIPEFVVGDPTRLMQILVNLIGNAFKFTNDGEIVFESRLISQNEESVTIRFIVKDTGIGISEEMQKKIFERFDQGNTETTRIYGGTGLGLSIVKKLVELQNGTIELKSLPGIGSEFSVTINYELAKNKEARTELKLEKNDRIKEPIHVLLVEDNAMNQRLAKEILLDFGFDVTLAINGEIALELLHKGRFDIILMDIQMPVLDGYHTAEKIRNDLKLDIPIIAMTAHVLTGEKEKCLSFGMNDYLSKPFSEEELYNKIKSHLSNSKHRLVQLKDKSKDSIDLKSEANDHVTNIAYLNEIAKGKKSFVLEMINIFLSQTPEDLLDIESAINKNDFESIQYIAHRMKTSIRFVGLSGKIEESLDFLENEQGENISITQIQEHFEHIKNVCNKALEELKVYREAL